MSIDVLPDSMFDVEQLTLIHKVEALERQAALADELAAALGHAAEAQPRMLALMAQHEIVIDNLQDKMQKWTFALYTELCEIESEARVVLAKYNTQKKG